MSQTTILSSIARTDSKITKSITAGSNCGTLSLILTQLWTKQMLFELPNINFTITYNGTIYADFNINMETINTITNKDSDSDLNIEPYSISIYNIPSAFELIVTPMFDENSISAHNELIYNGIENGTLWTSTDTFPIKILFDDTNVSSSSSGSGGTSDYNELENKPTINNVVLIGNKTLSDLGITNPMMLMGRVDSYADLANIQNPQAGWLYLVGLTTDDQLSEYVYTANNAWELVGYNTIVIDSTLSTVSENPVQNKVLTNALNNKADLSIFDPISESDYENLPSYTNPLYFIYEE